MRPLKLPEYKPKIAEGKIFCLIRKKGIVLTAEEWVRQHFLNLLISHMDYPKGMIRLEQTLSYFKNQKRSDILALDRNGDPFLLVECKSYEVKLDARVLAQLTTYNKVTDSRYLAISNGLKHFVWEKMGDVYVQRKEFPRYVME